MRECSYELYRAVFEAVREGIASGDADIVPRISRLLAGRTGAAALVGILALIEAKHGERPRSKDDVCNGVLCNERCAAWAEARRGRR